MGVFYISYNYLVFIRKKYRDFGIEDFFIEFGVYVVGFIFLLMKGKLFNRGIRVYKFLFEAMFRFIWMVFIEWYFKLGNCIIDESKII